MPDDFHDSFLAAIAGDLSAITPWCEGPAAITGLSVYRNTMAKGCVDALLTQFPTVERVVGPAWLAAAAAVFAEHHPPEQASLLRYGGAFPVWLTGFPPAAGMMFIAGLAGLDLLWTESHLAADAAPLKASDVAALKPEDFSALGLTLHPATRFVLFEDTTPSLWRALQPPGTPIADFELEPEPEGLLFVRQGLDTRHRVISGGSVAFLAACAGGQTLADAALSALSTEPQLDLSTSFADLVAEGVFTSVRTVQ